MNIIITGTLSATPYQAPQPGAFYANSNYAPACCTGAITSDNALDFLRKIAGAS